MSENEPPDEPEWMRDAPPPVPGPVQPRPPSRPLQAVPPAPAEPPPHDAPPPWLDDEPAAPAGNAVPISSAWPERPLRSRSYLSLYRLLSEPGKRERVLGSQSVRFNELRNVIEIGGEAITDVAVSEIRAKLELMWVANKNGDGMKFAVEDIDRALAHIASSNRYHPVQNYLRGLKWNGEDWIDWLCTDVLGIREPSPIELAMMRRWLISSVARAMKPGCKVDTVLILAGGQGAKKSTFFELLAGEGWFCDSSFDPSTKDGQDAMAGHWIYEWPELESMQRARSQNSVKAFLSSRSDTFRPPYGKHRITRPRTCVIVGTSNDDDFLTDRTGNRRYWPIHIGNNIDLAALKSERDQVWAQAFHLYQQREQWWLTPSEEHDLTGQQSEFEASTSWDTLVAQFLSARLFMQSIALHEVMSEALRIELRDQKGNNEVLAAAAMKKAGWQKYRAPGPGRPSLWRPKKDGLS